MKWIATVCCLFAMHAAAQAVLVRDIDRRPLPKVALQDLSPQTRKAVAAIVDDQKAIFVDSNRTALNPVLPQYTLERIPVAPAGHHLYELSLTGEFGCTGNTPNCRTAVLDETSSGVDVIDDNGFNGVSVVRRPNLQMPDIAFYEQEGHAGMSTTVYRFDGAGWKPFRCAYADIVDFPPDRVVADRPCTP